MGLDVKGYGCEISIEQGPDGEGVIIVRKCGRVIVEAFERPVIEKAIKQKKHETKEKEAERPEMKGKDLEALEEQALKKLKKKEAKDGRNEQR